MTKKKTHSPPVRIQVGRLDSAKALFAKLTRDRALLDNEVSSDRFFNFAITGYSLIDWIKNDPGVPAAARTPQEIVQLNKNEFLAVCGDLATASKHFHLTTRPSISTASADSSQGYGVGRWGKGGYGVGEESISIRLLDGRVVNALVFADGVVEVWSTFFAKHGI